MAGTSRAELMELAVSPGSVHFHNPYVLPTVVCHNRSVPSSEPLAYNSPSGLKLTACTGPKCPLNDSTRWMIIRETSND